MRYYKPLDALRAIAVVFVLIHHYVPEAYRINRFPYAQLGVSTFFVLSGFLITSILFRQRQLATESKGRLLRNFYWRRTLRIFPIYYLVIFALFIFQGRTGTSIGTSYPYFLTYTANVYFFQRGHWDGSLSHLWTLSVEEQFYLLWPCLILFVRDRFYLPLILSFIGIGVVSQYLLIPLRGEILLPACFDGFGMGALLAWVSFYGRRHFPLFYKMATAVAAVATAHLLLTLIFGWWLLPISTVVSLMALWLIGYLTSHEENLRVKFVFNNRVLIFLGRISYGLYLYQNFIPKLITNDIVDKYFNPLLPKAITRHWGELFLVENLALLVLISWLSYRFIETPFLRLKKYFANKPVSTPPALTPVLTVIERPKRAGKTA